jgi:hypothetical protein
MKKTKEKTMNKGDSKIIFFIEELKKINFKEISSEDLKTKIEELLDSQDFINLNDVSNEESSTKLEKVIDFLVSSISAKKLNECCEIIEKKLGLEGMAVSKSSGNLQVEEEKEEVSVSLYLAKNDITSQNKIKVITLLTEKDPRAVERMSLYKKLEAGEFIYLLENVPISQAEAKKKELMEKTDAVNFVIEKYTSKS